MGIIAELLIAACEIGIAIVVAVSLPPTEPQS